MRWLAIEHSTIAYRTDFALYGFTTLAIGLHVFMGRADRGLIEAALLVLAGVGAWTLLEYGLHRVVLHRMLPFRTWHAEHHRRPSAWICTPTLVSAALFLFGIYVPSRVVLGESRATAFTLGILAGYVVYAAVHHALHHAPTRGGWLRRRMRAHALHHSGIPQPGNYGVTTSLWDRVFGTHRTASASRLTSPQPRPAAVARSPGIR